MVSRAKWQGEVAQEIGRDASATMQFRQADKTHYAGANCLETVRVEALARAIYSGWIKIIGPYACVNHISTYPSDAALELIADTPVPIKLQHGQIVEGMTGYHEVTVAKTVNKKIHVCHFKPEYCPSDNAQFLNPQRIYFAGTLPQSNNSLEVARKRYSAKQKQVRLGISREVKTEKVAITVLGFTNGLITALYSDYKDGLLLEYSPGMFHTFETLVALYSHPVERHVVWESDLDGRHIKVVSKEDVKATWRYDTTIWLSDRDWAMDSSLHDRTIQKAARQLKNLTLESYATMVGGKTLDIVAAYQR